MTPRPHDTPSGPASGPQSAPGTGPATATTTADGETTPRPPGSSRSRAVRLIPAVAWLTALWVLLWRDVSWANVASGLVLAVIVTLAVGREPARPSQGAHTIRPLALAHFIAYFTWKLLESNVVLAREVLTPVDHLQRGILAVEVSTYSPFITTVVANAVSLTPGTLTVRTSRDSAMLYVHVLHLHDREAARADVQRLDELALASFAADRPARANDPPTEPAT